MKNLFLAALGIFLMTAILESCKDNSTNVPLMTKAPPPPPTPANPALVYGDCQTSGPSAIYVADTDGTHQTAIFPSLFLDNPNWAPATNSVVFDTGNSVKQIMALDVAINSSGVPYATNVRTIDAGNFTSAPVWSSTASVNQIAFLVQEPRNQHGGVKQPIYLCTISASGGARDTLRKICDSSVSVNGIAWSPDDSKIAICLDSSWWASILIVNSSTGATTDSIVLSTSSANYRLCDWSRGSTTNKLLVSTEVATAVKLLQPVFNLYYLTPSTGATLTNTNLGYTYWTACWSPNNSSILYESGAWDNKRYSYDDYLAKAASFTTSTKTLVSQFGVCFENGPHNVRWHR